jgi:PhoPQ-activated pathogenicity-related protein/D-alanyl-D-alanine dipeptidase
MKYILQSILCLLCSFCSMQAQAQEDCSTEALAQNPGAVLSCYINLSEDAGPLWVIDMDEHDKRGLSVETYKLISQQWPKPDISSHGSIWKHRMIIYRPDVIKSHQALLFVNGGTSVRFNKDDPEPVVIDFAHIALLTHSVVVDLQDIPEQYLTLDNNVPLKEDGLVAYSWAQYLKDPLHQPYWPVELPMAKAIVKAMDATQQIIAQEDNFKITHFVVSGVSKRGWATWLSAIADKRVNAIVPVVINVLNLYKFLDVTYSSYKQQWPQAFHDYEMEHIPEKLHTPAFISLTKIIDPLMYLQTAAYKERLNIPKYIINASGDDFFIPDSLNLYLAKLPGENLVRIAPNQSHYISNKIVENALLAYYETVIFQIPHPQVHWKVDKNGVLQSVSANVIPVSAKLWEAQNPIARDFRLAKDIAYTSKKLTPQCQKNHCAYTLDITAPKKGWQADFVELTYQFTNGDPFILTTPAYVIAAPEKSAPTNAVATSSAKKILAPIKKIALIPQKSLTKKPQEKIMSQNNKDLTHLVDVIALSKKKCPHAIRAHLAYATKENFVGELIDGYTPGLTHFALMTKDAAEALCQVQNDLIKNHGLEIKIYDSYRPRQAVLHFVRWSKQVPATDAEKMQELARKKIHYPDIDKADMFKLGYVSDNSQHSFGHTVDLVLVDRNGRELDQGTCFDFMGKKSHGDATSADIGEEAVKNRLILSATMEKYGFIAYPNEYWHYSYKNKLVKEPMHIPVTPELAGLNVE